MKKFAEVWKRPRYGICLACFLVLLQQLPLRSSRWVEDESWYSIPAYTLLQEGHIRNPTFADTDFEYKADMRPPAMPLALSASFLLFGTGILPARLLSLLSTVAIVILVYLLAQEFAGPWAALISSVLVASDNFLFLAGRTARPEAPVTLFSLLGIVLYLVSRRRSSAGLGLLSGLSIGVALNFHVLGLAAAASVGLLLLRDFRLSFWKQKLACLWLLGVLLTLVPTVYRVYSSQTNHDAFVEMYGRGERVTTMEKLQGEKIKYLDFLGVSSQRFHLPLPVPYRLHIAIALTGALIVLYYKKRATFEFILIGIIPNILLWVYLVNKSSRYFAITAPWFALLLGCAAVAIAEEPNFWRNAAVAICILVAATQVAGNFIFVYRARTANYKAVAAGLRRVIPPGATAYGAIAFWMALHERHYYCYDRTPFEYAVGKLHPAYLILNDRVMEFGSGYGEDNFAQLRSQTRNFVQAHAALIGTVPSAFYGDLQVYKVR